MSIESSEFKRVFTVEEANAMLPLVRAICQDLVTLAGEVIERRERFELLTEGRDRDRSDLYTQELALVEEELERDNERLQEYVQELRDLGIEPKDAVRGLVDFPSFMDDRVVYLCWKLDEPEVLYWHEVDAGYAGRQPLTAGSGATDDPFESDSDSLQ